MSLMELLFQLPVRVALPMLSRNQKFRLFHRDGELRAHFAETIFYRFRFLRSCPSRAVAIFELVLDPVGKPGATETAVFEDD